MIKITKTLCTAKLKETDPSLFIDSGKSHRICGNCKKSYKLTDVIYLHVAQVHIGNNVGFVVHILNKEEKYVWKIK